MIISKLLLIKFVNSSICNFNNFKFDLIVSNPPYIARHQIKNLDEDVKNFEPKIALDGGNDGLDVMRKVIYKSRKILKINGMLALEIGNGQYKKVSQIQIVSIINLSKVLIKKYKIKSKNILGHSDIAPTRKKDPGEKFPWKYLSKNKVGLWHNLSKKSLIGKRKQKINNLQKKQFIQNLLKFGYPQDKSFNKAKYSKFLTIAFQRRFRPELVNGIIDQECLVVSSNLIKNSNKTS